MVMLRVARPGHPTTLIDLGPATGRVYGQNTGGSIVVAAPPIPMSDHERERRAEAKRERDRAYYAADTEKAMERQRRYRARMRGEA